MILSFEWNSYSYQNLAFTVQCSIIRSEASFAHRFLVRLCIKVAVANAEQLLRYQPLVVLCDLNTISARALKANDFSEFSVQFSIGLQLQFDFVSGLVKYSLWTILLGKF